jgi:WD40 repeat protein
LTGTFYSARLWDMADGREVRRFEWDFRFFNIVALYYSAAAFSPDGRRVLTNSGDTPRLWDVANGREARRFEGGSDFVTAVAVSPDGRQVLTGSWENTAVLWDAATGAEIRQFVGHSEHVRSVAFSADGRRVLTGSEDRTVRLWDVATGKEVRKFEGSWGVVGSVAFSPDGRSVLTGGHHAARLLEVATGREVCKFEGLSGPVEVAFAPDGQCVLTSADHTARLWEIATRAEIRRFEGYANFQDSFAFSANGLRVLVSIGPNTTQLWELGAATESRRFVGANVGDSLSPDGQRLLLLTERTGHTAQLWDIGTGTEIQRLEGHSDAITSVAFSLDGRSALTGSRRGTVRLWDVANSQEIRKFEGHTEAVLSVAISAGGRTILTAGLDSTVRLWDVATGKEIHKLDGYPVVAYSPDDRHALSGLHDGTARLWDVTTAAEICKFEGHSRSIESVAFSADGRHLLTGSADHTARLWEVATGAEICRFEGHCDAIDSVAFSPNGRHVLTESLDRTARLWDAKTGQELCTLASFRDGSWAVVDPLGRFDASNDGEVDGLHWVVGNEPVELAQLKDRYYEPGLLAKLMGFNEEPLREVSAFHAPKLYPEVMVTKATAGATTFTIDLKNRGGGIGRVLVKVNGKEMIADARGPDHDPNAEALSLEIDLADDPRLKPGEENVIEVQAYNAEGYLRSRGLRFTYTPPGEAEIAKPDVWAIIAGASDYRGDEIDLRYAAKDAQDFATSLQLAAGRLFGADKVHLTLLSTDQDDPSATPTRDNLVKALEDARRAKPGDVLVVYMAGHGVNFGGQDGDFYYLTGDARTANLSDPEVRRLTSLSSQELTELIKAIPALKQVMILDTCSAGRLVDKLTESRRVPSSQIRALERVKDRTGMHILAGCAAEAVSYETSRYGQGLLTHSLLLGMRGAALREDEYVDVGKLFHFAADKVPELAKGIGGIQRPELAIPKGGASFDVGRLTSEDKVRVPLKSARPLVLRCYFGDKRRRRDVLGLSKQINDVLRDQSAHGEGAPVFVDADEFPGAYQVAGDYQVEAKDIRVTVFIGRGKVDVAEFEVSGQTTDLRRLAIEVVEQVRQRISSQ